MIYNTKKIILKNGKEAVLRSPSASDAMGLLENLKICAFETDFLNRYPEEYTQTEEEEIRHLENFNNSSNGVMIVCTVDGEIAGTCCIMPQLRIKTKHRAIVAISLVSKYWGLGIGTAMFEEMSAIAKGNGVLQLELDYIEGNERARALYEKSGFVQVAERPDAIRLKDGTMLKEFSMIKKL